MKDYKLGEYTLIYRYSYNAEGIQIEPKYVKVVSVGGKSVNGQPHRVYVFEYKNSVNEGIKFNSDRLDKVIGYEMYSENKDLETISRFTTTLSEKNLI